MPEFPLAIDLDGRSSKSDVTYRSPRRRSHTGVYVEVVTLEVELSGVPDDIETSFKSRRERDKLICLLKRPGHVREQGAQRTLIGWVIGRRRTSGWVTLGSPADVVPIEGRAGA